jgi:uncharacterized protein (DUF2336 family)
MITIAKDTTVGGRERLAETVGGLFVSEGSNLSPTEHSLMEDICKKLAKDVEVSVRRALAKKLARAKTVPHDLIVQLAHDEITVSEDIILYSVQMQDPDLLLLIKERQLAHQLAAARRFGIGAEICDSLIATKNPVVIQTMLENLSADINQPSVEHLTHQAQHMESWHSPLLHRPEITPALAKKMYWWVSASLRDYITSNFRIEDIGELDGIIEETVQELSAADDWYEQHDPLTSQLINLIKHSTYSLGQVLQELLYAGDVVTFERIFARLLNLPRDTVRKIVFEEARNGLGIACQSLGIADRDFYKIVELLETGARNKMSVSVLRRLIEQYGQMSLEDARGFVAQWRMDPAYLKAINSMVNLQQARKGINTTNHYQQQQLQMA